MLDKSKCYICRKPATAAMTLGCAVFPMCAEHFDGVSAMNPKAVASALKDRRQRNV